MNRAQGLTLIALGASTVGALAAAASSNWLAVAWAFIACLWAATNFAVTRLLLQAQEDCRRIRQAWLDYQRGENAFTRRARAKTANQ